jgi:protein-L-isoaspartate(D-aspartate) O-methyltransferase
MGFVTGVSGHAGWGKIHRRPNLVSPLGVMLLGLAIGAPAVLRFGQGEAPWAALRKAMVADQIAARGIRDPRVLAAMAVIPRHAFVPRDVAGQAYEDTPLPIGEGQTISQPYIVALMTECLALQEGDRVLEVGTGSGYQAAVLARIVKRVFTIEIDRVLAARATETFERLAIGNVRVRTGDGFFGWPEEAPFDAIIVTAATPEVPPALFAQLTEGGRLVLPLGDPRTFQRLTVITKQAGEPRVKRILDVRFVPMTGEILKKK